MSVFASKMIGQKRDGLEHSEEAIRCWIEDFLHGKVADYQMTAWLMAVYLNSMTERETVALTRAMLESGEQLNKGTCAGPRIDKHSTGGVGDKISLPLVAIAAASGLHVPMIAGRGLGHTGGTLDKLESITGLRVDLGTRKFERIVSRVGACIIGQTKEIAPADKRIYALRDVTGTVACRPLIIASILSKKLAAGLDGLILDVKVGRGAFMQNKKDARLLAQGLVRVATQLNTPTKALLSNMDQPLGEAIGNALEVKESIEILKDNGPKDATQLTIELAAEMLLLGRTVPHRAAGRKRAREVIESGHAFERFCAIVEAQGGDLKQIENPTTLPQAQHVMTVLSEKNGRIKDIDPLALAQLAQEMGAGRRLIGDRVDHAVGIVLKVKLDQMIKRGQPLCELHTQQTGRAARSQQERARSAFSVGRGKTPQNGVLLGRV